MIGELKMELICWCFMKVVVVKVILYFYRCCSIVGFKFSIVLNDYGLRKKLGIIFFYDFMNYNNLFVEREGK